MSVSAQPDNGMADRNPDIRRFGDSFQVFLGWNGNFDPNNKDDTNTWVWAARDMTSRNIVPRTHSNKRTTLPDKSRLHEYWAKLLRPSDGCSKAGDYFLEYVKELIPDAPENPFPEKPKAKYIRGAAVETDFKPKDLIDTLDGSYMCILPGTSKLASSNPGLDNVVHKLRKLEGWGDFTRRIFDRACNEVMHCGGIPGCKISEQPSFTAWLDSHPDAKKTYDDCNNANFRNAKDQAARKRKRENREDGEPEAKKAKANEDGKKTRLDGKDDDADVEDPNGIEKRVGAGAYLNEAHRAYQGFLDRQVQQLERLGGHWDYEFRFVTDLQGETENC